MVEAYSTYVASYQRGLGSQRKEEASRLIGLDHELFVLELARLLVRFLYAHVEKARRRSLSEMLLAASQARSGEELRARVLHHLEHFEFDERLDAIISSVVGGLDRLEYLLDDLVSPNDAAALRGTVARQLSSYPDNPGLLLLRAITEVLSQDGDFAIATDNLKAGIEAALGPYRIDPGLVAEACGQIAGCALKKPGAIESLVGTMIASGFHSRDLVRLALAELPEEVSWVPASRLMGDLALSIRRMLDDQRSVIHD